MAEDLCSFHMNLFILRPPKASPLLLRMIMLVFATVCGLYICSICLKQISSQSKSFVEVIHRSCDNYGMNPLRAPYVHYPQPQTFGRAECEGNPVRFFVIISMQRSGSGWFETLLNSHINLSSNGEIFSIRDRRSNISSVVRTLDRVYDLDWLSSASKNECSAAIGFKWMLNQGLMEYRKEILDYLNRKGVHVIFLFRRNLLRRMVSELANSYDRFAKLLNGTHKSHVHSLEEANMLSKYKPLINSTSLISQLKQMDLLTAKALKYFHDTRHIILYYEDLVKNHTKLLDVQDFLGLPHMKLTSRQVKIHKGPLEEHIQNWNDVSKVLNGTSYEIFLHKDY
ncbi:hypothetical protein Nepgr_008258 [Nepenthes gracilis]|uniref:Sulfotransferase n=1 Tax=Nepenthes gracilis TaxID=150966 RepID=A0AAD3XJ33_NEPGR|nr:hypothetical protein Nepgr_008258 [Nepenthes gracilis]